MTVRELVRALGGNSVVAEALGISAQAVTNMQARDVVPARHHIRMWRLAEAKAVAWVPPGSETPASTEAA
jgi:hypothetical protein